MGTVLQQKLFKGPNKSTDNWIKKKWKAQWIIDKSLINILINSKIFVLVQYRQTLQSKTGNAEARNIGMCLWALQLCRNMNK